eukprot:3885023-Rhodomonas_salina.1
MVLRGTDATGPVLTYAVYGRAVVLWCRRVLWYFLPSSTDAASGTTRLDHSMTVYNGEVPSSSHAGWLEGREGLKEAMIEAYRYAFKLQYDVQVSTTQSAPYCVCRGSVWPTQHGKRVCSSTYGALRGMSLYGSQRSTRKGLVVQALMVQCGALQVYGQEEDED